MCKLYIETSDLDAAVEAYINSENASVEGATIQALGSEKLKDFAKAGTVVSNFFSLEDHTLHAITAGIAIGLKLAESGLALNLAAEYQFGV